MPQGLTVKQQLIAACAWLLFAAACLTASTRLDVVILIWWPNGIAVAVLYLLPPRKWPLFIAVAGCGAVFNNWFFGSPPLLALGLAIANFAEAIVVATIARRIMHGKEREHQTSREMFGLVGAAAAGAFASTFISALFRWDSMTPMVAGWWFVTVMLGTLVATPIILAAISWAKQSPRERASARIGRSGELFVAVLGVFALSIWVLFRPEFSLLFLPMSLTIFAVTRYGQLGAALCIFAFSAAGTIHSLGGKSPAAFLDYGQQQAGLFLQVFMIAVLATSVPLAALLMSHRRLADRLKGQNHDLRKNLALFSMAETVAGMGRWTHDPRTGEQEWSRELYRINGLEPANRIVSAEVLLMLPDGGKQLRSQLGQNRHSEEPFDVDFSIMRPDGEERDLHMRVANEFAPDGELIQQFGVVMDVTDQRRREKALDEARGRAMRLAAEAQILANTDALTGLANRRSLLRQLHKCVRRSEESGRPLAIISFDVDHFKRVNDRFGHQAGDEVLTQVAKLAREQARTSDLIGRTGGEEFVWLMPGATSQVAHAAAERLRQAIEMQSGGGEVPAVTVSIGISEWQAGVGADELLAKSDTALYDAKNAGRNQVRLAA